MASSMATIDHKRLTTLIVYVNHRTRSVLYRISLKLTYRNDGIAALPDLQEYGFAPCADPERPDRMRKAIEG
jgi:hypothetical protein